MSEIEYRALCIKVSHGIDWQTEGETLLSLCKGRLIAEGSENLIGNAAVLLEQLEGQNKLGIDHLEVLKELLSAIEKWALVDNIDIFEINRKNYLSMLEKVILKLDELNCLEELIRICTPYLEEGTCRVGGIESIRVLFKKLESNDRLGPANLGILKEILKKRREYELLREVEEFEKKRKDENIRDRERKEAAERHQARVAVVYAVPRVVGRMMGAVNVHCNFKTVGGVVVAVGACVVLYKYSRGDNDIQQFANVFNEAILPAANSLRAIGNGSLCFTVQAEDRAALQLLWEQYQDNTLQTKLQDFLVTEEIKQLADGEDVSVTVYIDEQEYQDACLDLMMEVQVFSDKEYGHHRDTNRRNSDSVIYMEPKENEAAAVLSTLKTAEIKFQQEKIETLENQINRISKVYSEEEERDLEIQQLGHITDLPDDGIKLNCNEKELKAKLYNNRAIAHFKLGNHQDSLIDAEAAIELNPTFLEAIVRGAAACVELKKFEEAITWCNKGLVIDKNNRILSVSEVGDKSMEEKDPISHDHGSASSGDVKKVIDFNNQGDKHGKGNYCDNPGDLYLRQGDLKKAIECYNQDLEIAKEGGDKHEEGCAFGNLGIAYDSLGDYKKAIECHNLHLKIAKDIGDKRGAGVALSNLGIAYNETSDLKKSVECHNLHLKIAKELGDKHGEGAAYGNLGITYNDLGDFKKAIKYHNLNLKIAKELGDKQGEGAAYGNLGTAYDSLGDLKKAVEYLNLDLEIAKEVGDKHGEGHAYGNLGNAYQSQGEFKNAIEYHNLHLKMAQQIGDKHAEGNTYGNLGNAYHGLGEFKKAIEYHNLDLKIVKEIGDRYGEGKSYGNLGNAYRCLGDLEKANELYCLLLKIAEEVGDQSLEALAYYSLGCVFEAQGGLPKAVEHFRASVNLYNSLRVLLKSKDEWKVNFRNQHQNAYSGLCRVLVKQVNIDEALFAAEKGRAQALTDLMESSFWGRTGQHKGSDEELADLKNVPSDIIFQVVDDADVNLWFVTEGKQVQLRQSKLTDSVSENSGARQSFKSFIHLVYTQIDVRSNVRCENRSLDALRESRSKVDVKTKEDNPHPPIQQDERGLSTLYDTLMKPVADLVKGDELLIIPDGSLWLAPYAALKDGNSKYLCESFRIRLAPSLTSLRLISDCPDDYHKSSGALLVGDPWVAEVTNSKGGKPLAQLPCAKEEVEMIGKILNITPITGRQATKREVLERLGSVSLVHFAAHGCMETGEIALTPDPHRIPTVPTEEDYILTIGDVLNVQLRAKLVVLSCCHSGRGEIKAEGVVGIARAFMGAGARSVLVSLWAIDDEATIEFMKCFYQHLAEGKPASESLNLTMKSLRESEKFHDIKYWAPFVLIGDDITLDFIDIT